MATANGDVEILRGRLSLEKTNAPTFLSGAEEIVTEAQSFTGSPVQEEEEASIQATFEKVVYEELGTPFKYRSVAVLVVHWAEYLDKDLQCGAEIETLKALFEQHFRFKYQTLTLDDKKKPQGQLNRGISEVIDDHDGDCRTHLLILYYTGHGTHHSDEGGLHITGVREPGRIGPAFAAKARWKPVEESLRDADADVLTILDTCSAGSVIKGTSEATRVYEVLAAAGRKDPTSAPGKRSFTKAMIDSLKDQLDANELAPFTTYDLNQTIMRRRKNQKSQLFSISGNTHRFVKLAPLQRSAKLRAPTVPCPSFGLTLRFVFANTTSLTAEQAKLLATVLSRSVAHSDLSNTGIQPTAIDWVDFSSVAGGSGSADPARLQESVKKVQRLWRASSIWRGSLKENGQKHELEDRAEDDLNLPKRRRGSGIDAQPTSPLLGG